MSTERRYFLVPAVSEEGGGTTADCPPGWSGTPDIGRGCYIVMHPSWSPEAPVLGENVQLSDLQEMDDATLQAELPIELPAGLTDAEINDMAEKMGFRPITVDRLLRHRVMGV